MKEDIKNKELNDVPILYKELEIDKVLDGGKVEMDNDKILEKYLDTVESERKDSELRIATNISDFKKELREDRISFNESLSKQVADINTTTQNALKAMDDKFDRAIDKIDAKIDKTNEELRALMKETDARIEKSNEAYQAARKESDAKFDVKFEKSNEAFKAEMKESDAKFEKSIETFKAEMKESNARFEKSIEAFKAEMKELNAMSDAKFEKMNLKMDKIADKITETSVTTTRWVLALVAAAMISMLGMTITFILKIWNP